MNAWFPECKINLTINGKSVQKSLNSIVADLTQCSQLAAWADKQTEAHRDVSIISSLKVTLLAALSVCFSKAASHSSQVKTGLTRNIASSLVEQASPTTYRDLRRSNRLPPHWYNTSFHPVKQQCVNFWVISVFMFMILVYRLFRQDSSY